MIFFILITLISRALSMNPISPLGHSVLWKKHGVNHPRPATMIKAQTPYSSPPQDMDKHPILCSPLSPCANSPESVVKNTHSDTPKSIDIEQFEEHRETSSPPVITVEECLREKARIDRVLAERAKLGPFLIESTERPVINDNSIFKESARAIKSQVGYDSKNHLNDNVTAIEKEYRCYGLNYIDVMAIRLYTSAMAFVINQALRNYSLYDMPIPTAFLPYIYALINGLAKIYIDKESNRACYFDSQPFEVVRYIPVLDSIELNAIQPILDAHQPGAYMMYPAFTSSSSDSRANRLWTDGFQCRFDIKARTAIDIQSFSINPSEYEAVFLPGTIFHILERDGPYVVMEEIMLQELNTRRAQLPC